VHPPGVVLRTTARGVAAVSRLSSAKPLMVVRPTGGGTASSWQDCTPKCPSGRSGGSRSRCRRAAADYVDEASDSWVADGGCRQVCKKDIE
jgi:hypothetical protein